MAWRDFRIGWRLLLQQPGYSLVVIGGLAVGFAACFLLFGYVAYCLNYNGSVPDNGRVVAVKQRVNIFPRPLWTMDVTLSIRDAAIASGLASEVTIAKSVGYGRTLRAGAEPQAMAVTVADPAFRTIFGITATAGDLQSALSQPDGLALTRRGAARLFGTQPPLGQRVHFGQQVLQVRALLPDPDANSSEQYEALIGSGSSAWSERAAVAGGRVTGNVYIKLKPGASVQALHTLLQSDVENAPLAREVKHGPMGASLNGRNLTDIALAPLRDIYFDDDLAASSDNYGRRSSVFGLAAGGLLILALAAINYVNLATVRTLRRQREIGLRKLLGAGTTQLMRQFLSEAVLVAVLAAVVGLILAWLLLPTFSALVDRPLDSMFTSLHALAALGFAVIIGIAAGAYPAWLAHHALPAAALAGRGNSETMAGLWIRRVLTVLQFGSAMALSAATLAVSWQTWYASHASSGFDAEHLLVLRLPFGISGKPSAQAFIGQLGQLTGVEGVTTILEAVGRDGNKRVDTVSTRDGGDMAMESKTVSANWFAFNGLHAVFGRTFNPELDRQDPNNGGNIMLNAAGALALGFASPQAAVGQTVGEARIVGIAPEIRFQGLHAATKALIYRVGQSDVVTVRMHATPEQAYRVIEPVWRRNFPDAMLDIRTQQAIIAERYADDARLVRILAISSVTAIALAAFGIYVLSAYSVQRKQREIVMRKLHGAAGTDIAWMLVREFSVLVGAGATLGLPLAALATQRYLARYTEHAPVGGWTLAAALLLAIGVALLATTRHTWSAMRMPPVLALKD